jgi:hypothetical protein
VVVETSLEREIHGWELSLGERSHKR